MWIRFKFRSAVNFDLVDIGDRPSISLRELKSKIITHKNLNLCHDLDLVFSDPLTGREFNDETYQIPSNSSVIIKRVPAGSVPSALPFDSTENFGMKKPNLLHEKSHEMDDFDDFGIDLCPVPEEIFPYSDLESERKNICDTEKANIAGSRSGCQKLQASDLDEVIPKGYDHNGTKEKFLPEILEPNVQEHVKLGKRAVDPYDLAEQYASLPSELRCSICNKFFKEAVMIPCCQHSFCEKCIREVLSEKAKCPKCSSHKFKAEELLPNLSLRQAIEHFLESQNHFSISENALHRFAPDEESGIQVKDLSSAPTIVQNRPKNRLYPSATEKGSNHLMGESFHGESLIKRNASLEGSSYHSKNLMPDNVLEPVPSFLYKKPLGGESDGYAHPERSQRETGNQSGLADFQGENDPLILPQNHVQEQGEDRKVSATVRYRKADRTCYMCDAPDHFIRDCPFAKGAPPMLQSGNSMYAVGAMATYATPYWNNTVFGPMRPFTTMYANPGLMPFNAYMYPVSPIGVSPYMSSMYGHIPAPSGIPRMAGMAPLVGNRSENPSTHAEFLETWNCEIRGNHSNEYMMRRQPRDDEDDDTQTGCHNLPKRSQDYLSHAEREKSGRYSEGKKHTRRSHGNDGEDFHSGHDRHGKNSRSLTGTTDGRAYHAERSNSGVENMSNSSNRHRDGRHNHHHKITRKHHDHERRGHCDNDSSWNRRQGQKDKRRVYSDEKGFSKKHGSQFGSSVEPSSSGHQKKRCEEEDHSRSSKHSRVL